MATEGRLVFMTTNHPGDLDPALVRDGRVDMRLHLGWATEEQATRMFGRFFPGHNGAAGEFAKEVGSSQENVSMATIQNVLIAHCGDPLAASQAVSGAREAHHEKSLHR